jgi:hypothetical protein
VTWDPRSRANRIGHITGRWSGTGMEGEHEIRAKIAAWKVAPRLRWTPDSLDRQGGPLPDLMCGPIR